MIFELFYAKNQYHLKYNYLNIPLSIYFNIINIRLSFFIIYYYIKFKLKKSFLFIFWYMQEFMFYNKFSSFYIILKNFNIDFGVVIIKILNQNKVFNTKV